MVSRIPFQYTVYPAIAQKIIQGISSNDTGDTLCSPVILLMNVRKELLLNIRKGFFRAVSKVFFTEYGRCLPGGQIMVPVAYLQGNQQDICSAAQIRNFLILGCETSGSLQNIRSSSFPSKASFRFYVRYMFPCSPTYRT